MRRADAERKRDIDDTAIVARDQNMFSLVATFITIKFDPQPMPFLSTLPERNRRELVSHARESILSSENCLESTAFSSYVIGFEIP